MPNVTITQLPAAGPITGSELVAVVQNGQTLRATTGAISASPSQTQTFLTVNQEPTLPNSRSLSGATGIGITDNGALSTLQLSLNGASGSLEVAGNGLIVKTAGNAVTARQIAVSGAGLAITNGDGVLGNPTLSLTGIAASIANASGTGMLSIVGGSTIQGVQILGTSNQISVANGNGSGNPTIAIVSDPVIPGTAAMRIPVGTTAQQPAGQSGQVRYNSDTQTFDGYAAGSWRQFLFNAGVTSFSAGSTGFSPTSGVSGAVVLSGVLNASSGGTGVNNGSYSITLGGNISTAGAFSTSGAFPIALTSSASTALTLPTTGTLATLAGAETLTNKTISGVSNTLVSIGNSSLTNSSVTVNGTSISLGASGTITANTTNGITFNNSGSGDASGATFNGSAARTVSYNTLGASPLAGSSSLTTVGTVTSGTWNATPIANAYLANSSLTLGTTTVSLGATSTTLAGLTSVTLTQDPTAPLQAATKQYVDAVAEGLHVHAACACATTGTLASITGGTVTYNNGTAGVGATLTLSVALTTLDGYTLQNGDRILVKNEATQANNGIYTWATGGTVLTRATDFDTATEIASGDFTFVTYGTQYATSGWVQTTVMVTVGTTPITWAQFSGAGTYTAGTGLTLTGNQFSLTSPVTAALGGTGQTSYTVGDLLYASTTSALSKLADVAPGNVLLSGGVGAAPSYGKVNLSLHVTGTLPTGNGGTGLVSYTAGDLLYASGATAIAKLGIGAANTVLTSSGTAPQWSNTLSLTGLTVTNDVTLSGLTIGRGTGGDITNTVLGRTAFTSATPGQYNTAIGLGALLASTGSYNIAIGASAMQNATTASGCVALGNSALANALGASANLAIGTESLNALTTGNNNVAIGERSGTNIGSVNAITTGSNNTLIGYRTGFASSTQRSYATAIGSDAVVDSSNTIVLGRTSDTTVIGATAITSGYTAKLQVTGGIDVVSGALFATPEAGLIEFDGTNLSFTNDASSLRGYVPAPQIFRLAAAGSAIGPAIADYFGANSAIQLAAGGEYEITYYCYFTKTTAGNVTFTITSTSAPVNINGIIQAGAPAGGTTVGTPTQISLFNSTSATAAFGASSNLTTAVNHAFVIRILYEANATTAPNVRLRVTSSSGTVTPLRGSYYTVTKLPAGNSGNFVA